MTDKNDYKKALEALVESASKYIDQPIWFTSLLIDLRHASFLLGNDNLHDQLDRILHPEEYEGEDD